VKDPGRTAAWLGCAIAVAYAVFVAFPGLDIAVSGLFFRPGEGFWLARIHFLDVLRNLFWNASVLLVAVAVLLLPLTFVLPAPVRQLRGWAVYTILLYALSTGLLVNGILKSFWGRARPADVEAFGGQAMFTPPFEIADQCQWNCSFVSGEASAVMALALSVDALLAPRLGREGRRALRVVLGVLVALGSGLRIVTGRHFLSDVVFGILLTWLVAAFLSAFRAPARSGRGATL